MASPRAGRILAACLAGAAAAALAACQAPPVHQIEGARAALEEARRAGAAAWAPAELAHAEGLLKAAEDAAAAQASRWGFLRDYARAEELIRAAAADASTARSAALREKGRAQREAAAALLRARSSLAGARSAILIAPSPRDGRAEMARLRVELEGIEDQIPDVERLIEGEDYAAAAARARDLSTRVERALARFFDAIADASSAIGRDPACRRGRDAVSCAGPRADLEGAA